MVPAVDVRLVHQFKAELQARWSIQDVVDAFLDTERNRPFRPREDY